MFRSLAVALLGSLLPSLGSAHHSVAFYSTDKIELAGEITKVDWQYPHIQFGRAALSRHLDSRCNRCAALVLSGRVDEARRLA